MGIPVELAIIAIGACAALGVYAVLSQAHERELMRDSLRQLDDYEVVGERVRAADLEGNVASRALGPVVERATKIGRALTPSGYIDGIRKKFISAGRYDPAEVDRFLAVRVISGLAIPVAFWFFYFFNPLDFTGIRQHATFGLLALAMFLGPDARLNREVEARQIAIQRQLPDILDLLVISVEAGLGFEQAMDRTIAAVPGPLTEEFARMLGEIRAGSTRAESMRALDDRVSVAEVRSFVLAILQADTFGVSIGRVLRNQADEMRIRRRQLAQERAQKAPVKMLIPMVFCIFPALFVVILGPAIINISNNL